MAPAYLSIAPTWKIRIQNCDLVNSGNPAVPSSCQSLPHSIEHPKMFRESASTFAIVPKRFSTLRSNPRNEKKLVRDTSGQFRVDYQNGIICHPT